MGGQIKNGELQRWLVETAIVSEICRDFSFKKKLAMTAHVSDPFKRSTYLCTSESPPPALDGPIAAPPTDAGGHGEFLKRMEAYWETKGERAALSFCVKDVPEWINGLVIGVRVNMLTRRNRETESSNGGGQVDWEETEVKEKQNEGIRVMAAW